MSRGVPYLVADASLKESPVERPKTVQQGREIDYRLNEKQIRGMGELVD